MRVYANVSSSFSSYACHCRVNGMNRASVRNDERVNLPRLFASNSCRKWQIVRRRMMIRMQPLNHRRAANNRRSRCNHPTLSMMQNWSKISLCSSIVSFPPANRKQASKQARTHANDARSQQQRHLNIDRRQPTEKDFYPPLGWRCLQASHGWLAGSCALAC